MSDANATKLEAVKPYLKGAADSLKGQPWDGKVMKAAVVSFILDAADIQDDAKRNEIGKKFMTETPSWFGSNASQAGAELGRPKSGTAKLAEDYQF